MTTTYRIEARLPRNNEDVSAHETLGSAYGVQFTGAAARERIAELRRDADSYGLAHVEYYLLDDRGNEVALRWIRQR